jgi:hypothetical protein
MEEVNTPQKRILRKPKVANIFEKLSAEKPVEL